jgi:hypothetical protein
MKEGPDGPQDIPGKNLLVEGFYFVFERFER